MSAETIEVTDETVEGVEVEVSAIVSGTLTTAGVISLLIGAVLALQHADEMTAAPIAWLSVGAYVLLLGVILHAGRIARQRL